MSGRYLDKHIMPSCDVQSGGYLPTKVEEREPSVTNKPHADHVQSSLSTVVACYFSPPHANGLAREAKRTLDRYLSDG